MATIRVCDICRGKLEVHKQALSRCIDIDAYNNITEVTITTKDGGCKRIDICDLCLVEIANKARDIK